MEQDVRNESRVCQIPQGSKKALNLYFRPNPKLVAVSLTLILATAGLAYYWMLPPPGGGAPIEDPPYGFITINGNANFSATALLEGWPGDGSPENPYIFDGLYINATRGEWDYCISISNTQVSFTISNCNLTGGYSDMDWYKMYPGAGIILVNVTNGELVNNICFGNEAGIFLVDSHSNTVANNTCFGNIDSAIHLDHSDGNTVANNTCNNNNRNGISLGDSDYSTVANNTCNNNGESGISLEGMESHSNTVVNNTCFNNGEFGISVDSSYFTNVSDNICFSNGISGINLFESDSNTMANNTCLNNTEHDIYLYDSDFNTVVNNIADVYSFVTEEYVADKSETEESETEESGTGESDSGVLLFAGFVGFGELALITLVVGSIVGNRLSRGE